jgi:membrane-associated PAP2 superfamily phosphatase
MLKNLNNHIIITAFLLIAVITLSQFSYLDIFIQSFFYNFDTKNWLIDKNEPILKFFLYDGIKNLLILFAVAILFSLIFLRKKELIQEYKKV